MRRASALAGLVLLILLAIALFWRVWRHHENAEPYVIDQPVSVRFERVPMSSQRFAVRIASELR